MKNSSTDSIVNAVLDATEQESAFVKLSDTNSRETKMATTRQVAKNFFDMLCKGDFPGGFASMADDATWSIIGTTALSKTFNKATMLSELVPMLSTFKVAPQMGVDEIIVEGDRAVVLANVHGHGPTGPYEQRTYCFVLRIKDSQVQEIVEYLDTVAVEQAICGRKLVDA